ncbi:YhcH/YjgK/YiaL family protein [Mucilaginibacter sp. KACC 22063]|uniref:YhcH/YjgK/YiaL family protein n=1 Tax=Mucilaginibacter sp. KACC 22063 TaxID=3025666 RepID=UPI00236739D5|nr:YhcH/YjgK/YiaL family protein [Mucilaginibacter sp. KACC 22063]WDF56731.1 YhcH/YjgK/YiaL family protein [Mucilaginibacter sp. KACC 22063]
MEIRSINRIILIALTVFTINNLAYSQTEQPDVTEKAAKQWVKSKEWQNGSKLNVDPSVNAVEFYKQYHADPALWQKVFTYLRDTDLEKLVPGKYPIDGDKAYASVTEGPSKEMDKANWESHRNYIDLQYVIKGKEKIGVVPINRAVVTNFYDPAKDAANYTAKGKYYIAEPGTFYLFFPQDVHRPNIKVDGFDTVKKLVIKIHVAN